MLVLHYTGMRSAEAAIARLCDPAARVSAHYVIDERGAVTALVPEEKRAWHAGVSAWRGRGALNDVSIGIEIANPGHEWGYRPFPEVQMRAVIALARDILHRWPIPAAHVVGHSDIAPSRKQDPGELFPWRRLAAAGVGLWTDAAGEAPDAAPAQALAAIGYEAGPAPGGDVITAFQRRWLPGWLSGELDMRTARRIDAVARLFTRRAIAR